MQTTHEAFVHAIRETVLPRIEDPAARARIEGAKLVYGGGPLGVRGVCYHGAWQNGDTHDFIEIAALGEESPIQLAGTTIHELAHCLAGVGQGHGPAWKQAAKVLGLDAIHAGGQAYSPEHFDADIWNAIQALPTPTDGTPAFLAAALAGAPGLPTAPRKIKRCPLGIGTRGGRSRGTGSGSRLRLWVCGCPEGTVGRKVRVASDDWDATCNRCNQTYAKSEAAK